MARDVRRGIQLSRRAAQSRLSLARRSVRAEILDELAPADARARRSRRDLQRVNRVMGSCAILRPAVGRALASLTASAAPRILELGAGDGTLALRLARGLAARWPSVELTLLDRQPLIAHPTGIAFAHLGWTLRPLTVDALAWARAPTQRRHRQRWDVILANLFLHHFEADPLRELLAAAAERCDTFIACEPRRGALAHLGARLLPALAVSRDTLHDALASVEAGFRGEELSRLWPGERSRWRLMERRAGLFSHVFIATRGAVA